MENGQLKNEILKTLSFMEPMSLEHILLDLDQAFTLNNPKFCYEDLLNTLEHLRKSKKIKLLVQAEQQLWIKIFPKRSFLQKIRNLF